MPEVIAIHISVEQAIVAHFTFRQGLSGQHPASHAAHVFAIPVLFQSEWYVTTSACRGVYVLLEILRRLAAGTTHAPFGLWAQVSVGPGR